MNLKFHFPLIHFAIGLVPLLIVSAANEPDFGLESGSVIGLQRATAATASTEAQQHSLTWREIASRLEVVDTVRANFEEYRHSPARRTAGRFNGILRWDNRYGLSLQYTRPRQQTILMTRQETLLATDDGKVRALPRSEESDLWTQIMFDIFALRLDEWERQFEMEGQLMEADSWQIQLTPKPDSKFAGAVRSILLEGQQSVMRKISFRRDLTRKIEINLSDTEKNPVWEDAEAAVAFPRM